MVKAALQVNRGHVVLLGKYYWGVIGFLYEKE